MTAESCCGSSPAKRIRFSVSRQLRPQSTKRLVPLSVEVSTVLFPFDPLASTVMRNMHEQHSGKACGSASPQLTLGARIYNVPMAEETGKTAAKPNKITRTPEEWRKQL